MGIIVQAAIRAAKSKKFMINHGINAVDGLNGTLRGKESDPVMIFPDKYQPETSKKVSDKKNVLRCRGNRDCCCFGGSTVTAYGC